MREHFDRRFSTRVYRPPLSPHNGGITGAAAFDHETEAVYMLMGQASDGGGGRTKAAGTVTATDNAVSAVARPDPPSAAEHAVRLSSRRVTSSTVSKSLRAQCRMRCGARLWLAGEWSPRSATPAALPSTSTARTGSASAGASVPRDSGSRRRNAGGGTARLRRPARFRRGGQGVAGSGAAV